MPRKIVLSTIGSLGDVHPMIALGLALKARGFAPVVATPDVFTEKTRLAGLEPAVTFPSFAQIARDLGKTEETIVARTIRDPDHMIRLMLRYLDFSTRTLDEVSEGAAAIVSAPFATASPIIAEKRRLPLIRVMFQPMMMMSPHDPPATPDFWMLAKRPTGASEMSPARVTWNRLMHRGILAEIRRRYARRVNEIRAVHGLAATNAAPMFDSPDPKAPLTLGLYSEALAPLPPDAAPNTKLTGFPFFDSATGAPEAPDPELEAFLAAGPAPIVFTLGTYAVYSPGDFYANSLTIAERLGQRALLLVGPRPHGERTLASPNALVRAYAPHSSVFPRASAIVHHGGAGTTGQAMRAGKPQLIVPHLGDQADNAARIARAGLGAMISPRRYAARAGAALARLLSDHATARRAEGIAVKVRAENGAETAANAIELALAA
jgi:rhamnosyltransferase subunit B